MKNAWMNRFKVYFFTTAPSRLNDPMIEDPVVSLKEEKAQVKSPKKESLLEAIDAEIQILNLREDQNAEKSKKGPAHLRAKAAAVEKDLMFLEPEESVAADKTGIAIFT